MSRYTDNDSRLQLRESLVEAQYMASNNRNTWIGLISKKMDGPCLIQCRVCVKEPKSYKRDKTHPKKKEKKSSPFYNILK